MNGRKVWEQGERAEQPSSVEALDLRLVPGALAVWAATLVALLAGGETAAVVAAVACGGLAAVWTAAGSRRWAAGALAVLVMAAVASSGVALRTHELRVNPVREAAQRGTSVSLRVAVAEAPAPLRGSAYGARPAGERSLVRAELRSAAIAGRSVRSGGEVLMLVPTGPWRQVIPGEELTVVGKLVAPQHDDLIVAVLQVSTPPAGVAEAPAWQRVAETMRDALRQSAGSVLSPAAAALLPGLVFGDTRGLPTEVIHEFNKSGLAHLTAVSGANLAIVCGAVLALCRLARAGPVVAAAVAGGALAGFVVLAGAEPSVLRAAVMGAVALLALAMGRERSALPALAVAVMGLLLVYPELAVSVGFALSVLATAGLVVLAPGWTQGLHARGVPAWVAEALAAALAAHLLTEPLIAAMSGEVSLVAVVANLLAEPVVAPATVLGVAATVIAPLAPWLGHALAWLTAPELEWILAIARYAVAVPGATFEWPMGVGGGLLLACVSLVALLVLRSRRGRRLALAAVIGVCVVLLPVRTFDPGWPVQGWQAVACDVGQGDGLVLATGEPGQAVVVDTGGDPALMADCVHRLGVHNVPLIVLSHLHADHVGGLSSVLAGVSAGAVAVGPLHEPSWAWAEIRRDARRAGVPVVELSVGGRLRWPVLTLDVLGPAGSLAHARSEKQANDASLVLMATTAAGRVLLAGDVELLGQSELLASRADLHADVLKVPHHGSRYTTPRFLAAVRPRIAVISVGHGNKYGHPSPLVVGALTRSGARVLRTDQAGDVAVLGGGGLRVASRGSPVRPHE